MGRRGPKPKSKGSIQGPAVLKPQGDQQKRTPTSAFDPAAGKDIYEPEAIVGQRLEKGVTKFCVKWVGWDSKHNTWEPIEHLAQCEDMIAEFKQREKTRISQLDAAAAAKRREQQEAEAARLAAAAEKAAADRIAAAGTVGQDEINSPFRTSPRLQERRKRQEARRRSNPFWDAFDASGAPPGKMCCTLKGVDGNVCGEAITITHGPTGLRNHVMYKHPDDYIKLKFLDSEEQPTTVEQAFANIDAQQMKVAAIPARTRDRLHLAHARWIVKGKRPFSICEDLEYRDIWKIALHGAYLPPNHHSVKANVLQLSAAGQQRLQDVNKWLETSGMKPSIAGDIWSDRGVSLLGLCEYYIDDKWEIKELLLGASPFGRIRHTGEAIDEETREACVKAGLSRDLFSSVLYAVSDNASNMKNGWAGFNRGPCCVHTAQLSVKVYLQSQRIKAMRDKQHGIVAHFSHSTGVDGLGALQRSQRECNLPEHYPVKDVDTRWSSGHDQMEWFRVNQRAIQLYDVNHARKAGDAYRQHQMSLEDWRINLESVAVLQPIADWTQLLQGSTYPTLPLVLPTIYALINQMQEDAPLRFAFSGAPASSFQPCDLHPAVLEARRRMYDDWVHRWVTNIDPTVKRVFAIATLLHPAFKAYDFAESYDFLLSAATEKYWALRELRTEWLTVWKAKSIKGRSNGTVEGQASSSSAIEVDISPTFVRRPDIPHGAASPLLAAAALAATQSCPKEQEQSYTKKRKVTLSSLLASVGQHDLNIVNSQKEPTERDELEEYLSDKGSFEIDDNVLNWWQEKEHTWPRLSKMVKQFLAAPASSAGVERLFSAAGKMHGDLQKAVLDRTLQHSLFAAFNTD